MASSARPTSDYTDFEHTGPGTVAGRYLRSFWQPILRSQDLQPGRPVPVRILNDSFTLFRGESGAPYLVDDRCAHRRTQLSLGWVEGEAIRCFYHGWKYDGTGQCIEQPAESEAYAAKIRIPSYPVQEYLGLVFAYLGEGPAPELPRHPEFEGSGILDVETFPRPCNYFNDIDNACDPLHVSFVHRNSRIEIDGMIDMKRISAQETDAGVAMTTIKTHEGGGLRLGQMLMPNIQLLKLPSLDPVETEWRDFISWRVPIDDEHYASFNLMYIHVPDADRPGFFARRDERRAKATAVSQQWIEPILSGSTTIDAVRDTLIDVVRLQDDVVLSGQGAIPDRGQERLGRSDVGIILLRKIWARELRAFDTGAPRKAWVRTPDVVATTGIVEAHEPPVASSR